MDRVEYFTIVTTKLPQFQEISVVFLLHEKHILFIRGS